MLYDLQGWLRCIADYLLHVVVVAGVIHHVKDGNQRVFLGVAKGAAVDEVIAPHVYLSEALQLALPRIHQKTQTSNVLLLREKVKYAVGERREMVVECDVVDEKVQILSLLDHFPIEIVESVDWTIQPLLIGWLLAALEVNEVKPKQL